MPCAIDVSDGLLQDLGHICEMSGLGADIFADAVPISHWLRAAYPQEALTLACSGGEDYELLLVAPREMLEALRPEVTVIGEMEERAERRPRLLDASGEEVRLPAASWDHLRT